MDVQALFYKAKDFRSHYSRYDLLTPQPLERADFFGLTIRKHRLDALESAGDEDEILKQVQDDGKE